MLWLVSPCRGNTTLWKAVCGRTACTVWREGGPSSIGPPYPDLPFQEEFLEFPRRHDLEFKERFLWD